MTGRDALINQARASAAIPRFVDAQGEVA